MTKIHKDLSNNELHVPKDFDNAQEDSVLSKSFVGALEWVPKSEVGGQGPTGAPGSTLQVVLASDINNPIILNTSPANPNNRDSVRVTQEGSKNNTYSDYMYDSTTSENENVPFSVDADGGGLWILIGASWLVEHQKIMNGYFIELIRVIITSDGATVTLALDKEGGGDLTILEDGALIPFDTTPALTLILNAGSDTSPTENFVYILNKILTVSTVNFPAAQHQKVGRFIIPSATTTQADGPYKMHVFVNSILDENNMGSIDNITDWIRRQNATWLSGVELTTSVGINIFDIIIASGLIKQMHDHIFPAFDTSTSDFVNVVNDFTTSFLKITDLTALLIDSSDVSMSNRRFNLVVWGSVNEQESRLFINLPSSSYNNDSDSISDIDKTSDFSIPASFTGTGFLIARLTVRHISASSTWSILNNEDLRGQIPSTTVGGIGATKNEFNDNVFRVIDENDNTKKLAIQCSDITPSTTRIMTIPDRDGIVAFKDSNEIFENNLEVKGQGHSPTNTLTDEVTIATNCDDGNVHTVILGANRTLGAPTNLKNGATYIWIIKQDGVGSRTLAYNAVFKFEGGFAPILSTTANAVDILNAVSDGTNVFVQLIKDFS